MTIKCSPHHWTTPKPGDTDLICPDCGRALSILYIDEYKVPAILWAIGNRPADLNAFRGFLNRGPRAEEFHPEGIERSRSLARERERISDPNKAKKYRCLKEKYHKPGFYSGWKDDNETYLPIVWRPDGKVLPLGPSLAFYSLSPFFGLGL